jgi:hypothetical protein
MRAGKWAALAFAALVGGCGNDSAVKPFSPRALLLASQMDKAIKVHSNGEAAGTLHEADRMFKAGQIEYSDFDGLRRIEAALRENDRNLAVRIYETAMGRRASATETPEEKAATDKAQSDEASRKQNGVAPPGKRLPKPMSAPSGG